MTFLASSQAPGVTALSLLTAVLAGHALLTLAARVRFTTGRAALASALSAALMLGTGLWSMHFLAMVAWRVPIVLGYAHAPTLASWAAAVAVMAIALALSTRETLGRRGHALGALAMGTGLCAMHFIGFSATGVVPGIVWDPGWLAGSALAAVAVSGAALRLFFGLRRLRAPRRAQRRALAGVGVGLGFAGVHALGTAAASLRAGTVSPNAGLLSGRGAVALVAAAGIALLLLALVGSTLNALNRRKARRLAASLAEANERLQAVNAELQRRAFEDPLTALPNRVLFEDRLAQAVRRLGRAVPDAGSRHAARERLAVFFIDLDGFKPVNDSLGHAAGDGVLLEIAARLRRAARESDTVARVGGDEFLVLLENVGSLADAVEIAGHILRAIAAPLEVANQSVEITASIGIVLHPDEGQPDKLIAHADSAMYVAKRGGGDNYAVFESAMDAAALSRLTLQNDLRQAASRGQMQLHYQPKVDCTRGRIIGVEALLRWTHPVRGPIGPDEFIPIAERHGIMTALGQWVIEEACRQISVWADDGLRMRVAINLSAQQLREADLVDRIDAALRRHGVEASQLLCEITESVAMEDIRATQATFDGLGRIGVFLSIDDFGTGYSSLSYLRRLPARQLKIDRSFIDDLEASSDARAVVDAVIRLAHALGLSVVAEGVETAGQRSILGGLGCDELQGYFFARPMPAARLLEWARGNRPEGSAEFSPSVMHDAL